MFPILLLRFRKSLWCDLSLTFWCPSNVVYNHVVETISSKLCTKVTLRNSNALHFTEFDFLLPESHPLFGPQIWWNNPCGVQFLKEFVISFREWLVGSKQLPCLSQILVHHSCPISFYYANIFRKTQHWINTLSNVFHASVAQLLLPTACWSQTTTHRHTHNYTQTHGRPASWFLVSLSMTVGLISVPSFLRGVVTVLLAGWNNSIFASLFGELTNTLLYFCFQDNMCSCWMSGTIQR